MKLIKEANSDMLLLLQVVARKRRKRHTIMAVRGHHHDFPIPRLAFTLTRIKLVGEHIHDSNVGPSDKRDLRRECSLYWKIASIGQGHYKDGHLKSEKQEFKWPSHATFRYLALDWSQSRSSPSGIFHQTQNHQQLVSKKLTKDISEKQDFLYLWKKENASQAYQYPFPRNRRQTRCAQSARKSDRRSNNKAGEDISRDGRKASKALKQTTRSEKGRKLSQRRKKTPKTVYNGYFEMQMSRTAPWWLCW